ncbi:MAG: enoyl-CoA hydratase/isomerase family protein [Novosphingobium sp.]
MHRVTEAPFVFEAGAFALPWSGDGPPLAVIDLDSVPDDGGRFSPPPFPVVGVGTRRPGVAARLDAVVESPVALASLAAAVTAQPEAAAIAVQVLRLLDHLPVEAGLVAESLAYGVLQAGRAHTAWLETRAKQSAGALGEVMIRREGDRLAITLAREASGNAIDRPMRDALREAFELAALDPAIARIVLRGAGRTFSLGADLAEFGTTRDPVAAHAIRMQTLPAHALARCADRLEVHVQGACVGAGLEMAGFARRITAHPRAWFQLPELAMGLIPGAGGCVSLARRIGRQRTALMVLSGRRISARAALEWGLVDALVDD